MKYTVTYRDEFFCTVDAKDKRDAIKQANISDRWSLVTGEGHREMYEVEKDSGVLNDYYVDENLDMELLKS